MFSGICVPFGYYFSHLSLLLLITWFRSTEHQNKVFVLIYKFPIDFPTMVLYLFDYRFVCCTNNYLMGLVPLLPIFIIELTY